MKNFFLLIFVFMFHLTLNAEECSCGSFEEGIYDYSVVDNSGGCCNGSNDPNSASYFSTYVPGPGRTWIVKSIKKIAFVDAIKACCPSA